MNLLNFYNKKDGEEVIPWEQNQTSIYVGFSILKDYPEDCGFVPAKNKYGKNDTKILTKVGYSKEKVIQNKTPLYVSITKYSRYAAAHFTYNFEDPDSPTKESLDESDNSNQPIMLEDNERYILDLNDGTIFDHQTKKHVSLEDVTINIFKQHLQTIKGFKANLFKVKIKSHELTFTIPYFLKKKTITLISFLFGKVIVPAKVSLEGFLTEYKYDSLVALYPEAIPFFNSHLKVSKKCILWVAASLLFIWKIGHYYFISIREMNDVYTIAITIFLTLLYDTILPVSLLFFANLMIKICRWSSKQTRIKF